MTSSNPLHPTAATIGIVGGGVLGMRLAWLLRDRGHRVTIVESAPDPGGLAAPAPIGPYTWDRFYHVISPADSNLQEVLRELGLADRLRWAQTRTGFFVDGRLVSMSSALEFLRFPPLSLFEKIRLAATIFWASRLKDWRRLEQVPVSDWLTKLSGRRVFERIWLPLLKSKLGENYGRTSAAFIWAIIARMYAARRSGMKREMFGYVDGGYAAIIGRLRDHLKARGVEMLFAAPVSAVRDTGAGAELTLSDGRVRKFDNVVLTVPCPRIAEICPQLEPAERSRLRGVVYQGIVCASLLLRKPLADFYVTNITEPWVPFTGVIEMTALVDRERFGGNSLVYLPRYLAQDDPFWNKTDEEVRGEFLAALARMYPEMRPDDVLAFEVARAREVLAISTLRYSDDWLPPVRTSLESVFVVNSAQIAHGTLNVNETLALADAKLDDLVAYLGPGRSVEAVGA